MIEHKFNMGDELTDIVTGLTGIVMVIAKYSTGCTSYGLLPRKLQDGKELDWTWLDESRVVRSKKDAIDFGSVDTGGLHPNPPQM